MNTSVHFTVPLVCYLRGACITVSGCADKRLKSFSRCRLG